MQLILRRADASRKSYGHAKSFNEAKAAFRTEYEKWLAEAS
jgi:hypothetical protein